MSTKVIPLNNSGQDDQMERGNLGDRISNTKTSPYAVNKEENQEESVDHESHGGIRRMSTGFFSGLKKGTEITVKGLKKGTEMTVSGLKKGTEMTVSGLKKGTEMTVTGLKKGTEMTVTGMKKGTEMTVSGLKKGTEMTVTGLKKGTEMTVTGIKKGTEMTVTGMREGAAASLQVLKDSGQGFLHGLAAAEEFLKLDPGDLAKLVPVFLEDAADGNARSISQLLDLDSKTAQYSIVLQCNEEGRTAVHKAAIEGRTEVIKLLVDYIKGKPDLEHLIDARDIYGSTPFYLVCMKLHKSNPKLAEYLLKNGASVDLVKKNTLMTPLHWACYHGSVKLADMINNRPEGEKHMYRKNAHDRYPLDMAGEQYMKKVYEESDQETGDSILPDFFQGSTSGLYKEMIHGLLAKGNDDQIPIDYQCRRLYWACVIDDVKSTKDAIKYKADLSALNPVYLSQNPFHGAARHGSQECLRVLLRMVQSQDSKAAIDVADKNGNTPLISAVRMSNFSETYRQENYHTIELLLKAGAKENVANRSNFTAIHYAKENRIKKMLQETDNERAREKLRPAISWDWVLVFAKGYINHHHGLEPQYDKVANWLRAKKLIVDVFPSMVNPKEVFVCVTSSYELLQQTAQEFHEMVQLLADREYRPYTIAEDHLFRPFKTQERLEICMKLIEDAIDIDAYLAGGVMKRIFSVHDESELNPIRDHWIKHLQPFAGWSDYTKSEESNTVEALNHVRSYYGEKVAFYYAWVCHYTATLTSIVAFSVALQVYHLVVSYKSSAYLAFYAIILTLWATYAGESWKNKQEELAYRWDMLDFEHEETPRPEFHGDETINKKTGFVEKYYSPAERRRKTALGLPVFAGFGTAVLIGFLALQTWKQTISRTMTGIESTLMQMLASVCYSIAIVVLDIVWKRAARYLTDWENHRTDTEWEKSYIFKKFGFMFINNTMAAFYTAFFEQDIGRLNMLMYSLIIVKQVSSFLKHVTVPIAKIMPKRHKLKATVALVDVDKETEWEYVVPGRKDLTRQDVLHARLEVAENDVMTRWKGTDDYFSEFMIQYAFIVYFSPAFPLAALITWAFNIIHIQGEMKINTSVIQRAPTTGARNIGSWQTIQEAMTLSSMIVNCCLLLFTLNGELGPTYIAWFPTYEARLWSILVLEHILLMVKVMMVNLIDDTPAWVIDAIGHRKFKVNMALEQGIQKKISQQSIGKTENLKKIE
jgi:anoctamin-10